jgi:hypothetical protein
VDSDFDDNSFSHFSPGETDSDEPLLKNEFKCTECDKAFPSLKSRALHMRVHSAKNEKYAENEVVSTPKNVTKDANDDDDKLNCDKCGKTFKLKIMLKRHHDVCGKTPQTPQTSPRKELLISLEPIDAYTQKRIDCEMCGGKFKTIENLQKHMRVVHAAVLKREKTDMKSENGKVSVPCLYCRKPFDDYYVHNAHFHVCPEKIERSIYECPVCQKMTYKKSAYFLHIKNVHFEPRCADKKSFTEAELNKEQFKCRMCSKQLPSQERLITHLAAHMSNIDEPDGLADDESR